MMHAGDEHSIHSDPDRPIGIIAGSGIGPEVMDVALACLDQLQQATGRRLHMVYFDDRGRTASSDDQEAVADFYRTMRADDGVILRSALGGAIAYRLRVQFGLVFKLVELCPMPELVPDGPACANRLRDMDVLLVRDNAQGLYHGDERTYRNEADHQVVEVVSAFDEANIRQVAVVAFRFAQQRRRSVHLFVKHHALTQCGLLWRSVFEAVGAKFPDVQFVCQHPDAGFADMLIQPQAFDVVAALDADADIISDGVAAVIHGTRAVTAAGNFTADGRFATYQTIHGSAEELAQKDVANPLGMVQAMEMMLRLSLGLSDKAAILRDAVRRVLQQGHRTADMTRDAAPAISTHEMKEHLLHAIRERCQ